MAFNWRCPFCNRDTTITDARYHADSAHLSIDNADGYRYFKIRCIVCPNDKCKRFSLFFDMHELAQDIYRNPIAGAHIKTWRLIPASRARVLPEYVPKAIVQDYQEACAIAEMSPKASATLARRCLQGMVRDFWRIKKARLIDEIKELEEKVDPLTWKAIDAVRKVGNIGAHMEQDINVIVDVDPGEAQKLIELIELLVDDWYVARHEREEKLKSITDMADKKDQKKKTGQ